MLNILSHISTISAILAIIIIIIFKLKNRQGIHLFELVTISLSAGTLPTGILFIMGSFDVQLLLEMRGVEHQIAIAGFVTIFVAIKTIADFLK